MVRDAGVQRRGRRWIVCGMLAVSLWSGAAAAGAPDGGDGHGGRLQFVRSLIEESSAAKRVAASQSVEARNAREKARSLHREAEAAHAAGDHARTDQLLGQASKTMFEAVRLAESAQSDGTTAAKKEKDFDARLASIEALVAAYDRVCDEKKCPDGERTEVRRQVGGRVNEARRSRTQGDIDAARSRLDQAYVAIKVAIEHRRGGDTLVRSLQFRNKEEEYRYELDRNDTHRMLITVLVGDKAGAAGAGTMQKLLEQAAQFRAQAEKEAAGGRFDAAVESLEAATKELQKALRGAGIYIPG